MPSTHPVLPDHRPALYRFALLTAGATFFLLLAGALVTSNDAGLSVPDWPLSHGSLMPEMVGGVFYEHIHRLAAATVGILTLVLTALLWKWEKRRWVRLLGIGALLAVIAQAILGGITVLYLLPRAVSTLHACLAQTFFCLTVVLALAGSRWWIDLSPSWANDGRPAGNSGAKSFRLAMGTTLSVFLQLILGSTLRHSGTVGGTKGAVLEISLLIPHLVGAILVVGLSLATWSLVSRKVSDHRLRRLSVGLLFLLALQILLGVGALWVRVQAPHQVQPLMSHALITSSHVTIGALFLAASLILTLLLKRSQGIVDASGNAWPKGATP